MPRPRIPDARDRLLSAGLSLFSRLGSERVNSNAIARRARLGIGTFYAHYSDKHALLRDIQLRTLAGLRAAREASLERVAPEPLGQVRASTGAALDFAAEHADAYRVTFGRERAGTAVHGPVLSESSRPIAAALRALQAAGRVDPGLHCELAARAYLAMEVGTILWWLDDRARAERDDVVETLVRLHPALRAP